MPISKPPADDPLCTQEFPEDTHYGAVLLSDQIEYYIQELTPPLLAHSDGTRLSDQELRGEKCLDTASYKLRLGDEAHVGGRWVRLSDKSPLVLAPHQVAVVKTLEVVNIPRFLVARWNLRVQWVYEGLLWVGGPQVDPGWQGNLYCPIYNLAEREVVVPFKARVFTMDFTRTTPVHDKAAWYGYGTLAHEPSRPKTLQDHDSNRLRSAPFEELGRLATMESRINSFIPLTFVLMTLIIAAIGVLGALGTDGTNGAGQTARGENGIFSLTVVAVVLALMAASISMVAMSTVQGRIPTGRSSLTKLTIFGTAMLAVGAGCIGALLVSGAPSAARWLQALSWIIPAAATAGGGLCLYMVWLKATRANALN